jgi:CIC family chloride channel protein
MCIGSRSFRSATRHASLSFGRERRWARPLGRLHAAFVLRDLDRWVVLGVAIGLVAGLGAVALFVCLDWATHFFLGSVGGYRPPTPIGEGHAAAVGTTRSWRIPAVTALGGLLCGLVVFAFAREAGGDGTDAAVAAVHRDPTGIRSRVSLVKIVASALTIGSGGSGGPEGPTTQISAGFASFLARRLRLPPADARIALTAAMGAGIGAIFRAPLGGAVFGAEVTYREDAEVEALIPSFVAAVVAFAVFGAFESYDPIFGTLRNYRFAHQPVQFLYFAAIGVACGLAGRVFAWSLDAVRGLFLTLSPGRVLSPALGALATGVIGIVLPGAIGTGYGWAQTSMSPGLLHLSPWVVLALPLAKILTTSLSIGSGGSGGLFGPGIVIGGFTGAAIWWVLHTVSAPAAAQPAPFVIVGMIACLGSIAHTPLAAMLMVVEMTGNLTVLPPAMFAIGIASLIAGRATLYRSQLRSRALSTPVSTRPGRGGSTGGIPGRRSVRR